MSSAELQLDFLFIYQVLLCLGLVGFFCVCKIIYLRFLTQIAIITYKKDETQRTASRRNCVILRRRLTEVTFFAGDKTSGLHVCLQAVQTSESKGCFLS